MSIVDEIIRLFATKGEAAYHGEAVSQVEHALQSAFQAESEGAPDALVVAALLHDVGHLLGGREEDLAERGIDDRHEDAGAAWLARHFGPEVAEPIHMHVAAKRYLCSVDAGYREQLSPASIRSLGLQGGPMTPNEAAQFEANPHYRDAVRLRRWDDAAKVPDWVVPGLDHYRGRLEAAVRESSRR
jgi:gamma-butyrobetaine dioxygenase